MNRYRKLRWLFLLLTIAVGSQTAAAAPYESYNYVHSGDPIPAPAAYLPLRQINGEQLGAGKFNAPEDLAVDADGFIYIADTGNNRIVVLNSQFELVKSIHEFKNGAVTDTFAKPSGVFLSKDSQLYIADTDKQRIVVLTTDGSFVRTINAPAHEVLPDNFRYVPIKVVVDDAGRTYVVGKGNYQGLLEFDPQGDFKGFIGVNPVTFDFSDLFWKRIMTKEQRSKMVLFIPVEFNNVDIDEKGFLYATTSSQTEEFPIKRLNPAGKDVLDRKGYFSPKGDIRWAWYGTFTGRSSIYAVTLDQHGMYSIYDNTRGRIFTYDRNGNLLYHFGQFGERVGNFKAVSAIEMAGDRFIVLDKGLNQLVVFEPTRYGKAVRQATILSELGQDDEATNAWLEVLMLNSNLEVGHLERGKAQLREGRYRDAMFSFQSAMARDYYSKAFEIYRKQWMLRHFEWLALGLVAAVILLAMVRKMLKRRTGDERGAVRMTWYTLFRPFKGFYELKYDNKGRAGFAVVLIIMLCLLFIVRKQYSGFIFNVEVATQQLNLFKEAAFIVAPFVLWCIANWSLTTLMDGEGKFGEIVVATAQAVVPIVLVQLPLLLLSHVFTVPEQSFFYLIQSVSYVWAGYLLFVGMMTVHQYTLAKTVVTMILTLVVIGIVMFLGLLLFSLIQEMTSFANIIGTELKFRF